MSRGHGLLAGRWELGAAIGSGGFATVYRAHDRESGSSVAVKLVPPGLGEQMVSTRLHQEASTLKKLSSRFVAKVLDTGQGELGAWMVMELVDGVPLAPESLGRALFPHEVLRVARGLFEGLAAAHACGIVHGDVKPSNVLVPLTKDGLDSPKLIDFGLARVTARSEVASDLGEAAPASGVVVGTARYMAPEVLRGAPADRKSDLYGAGLVLFELLGEGPLFPGATTSDQLRARIAQDPVLDDRVPLPLSDVLAKLLARDPRDRFEDASEALAAIVDLDTAPVSVVGDDIPPQSVRRSHPNTMDVARAMTSIPAAPLAAVISSAPRPSTLRPAAVPKLNALPLDPLDGLRETLRYLDLAMLDALARRERANVVGRIARAASLSLRLELDAAALILEPLALQSDVARAAGATLLSPRARRVTRARVDADRDDKFIDTVPSELAAIFANLGAVLSARDDAARNASRCRRALDRLNADTSAHDGTRTTLRIALAAARMQLGEIDAGAAMDLVLPFEGFDRSLAPLDRIARSMALATICHRIDEGRARDELERAVSLADDTGATLIEACAAASWGRLLVEGPGRIAHGLAVLERATTFLAHGDAPSLEHEAEHHRAAALIVSRRYDEAVPHLRHAREAAHAERSVENEILSASLEVFSHLAQGRTADANEAAATLGNSRIAGASGRSAALAWVARALDSFATGETDAAEESLTEARTRAREADGSDAFILVEVLGLVFDAARGGVVPDLAEPAVDLERFAVDHGFAAFYWFDVLRAALDRLPADPKRAAMLMTLDRLAVLLGPGSRLARDRRTSAPPPA